MHDDKTVNIAESTLYTLIKFGQKAAEKYIDALDTSEVGKLFLRFENNLYHAKIMKNEVYLYKKVEYAGSVHFMSNNFGIDLHNYKQDIIVFKAKGISQISYYVLYKSLNLKQFLTDCIVEHNVDPIDNECSTYNRYAHFAGVLMFFDETQTIIVQFNNPGITNKILHSIMSDKTEYMILPYIVNFDDINNLLIDKVRKSELAKSLVGEDSPIGRKTSDTLSYTDYHCDVIVDDSPKVLYASNKNKEISWLQYYYKSDVYVSENFWLHDLESVRDARENNYPNLKCVSLKLKFY